MQPKSTTIKELIERFDVLLFDAFGVLVDSHRSLPHADRLIDYLNKIGKDYLVVTNGSRADLEETAKSYQRKGLAISADHIISSGSLIAEWVKKNDLQNQNAFVLGPNSAKKLARESGLCVVDELSDSQDIKVIIIGNQDGFDFLPSCDDLLSFIYQKTKSNQKLRLLLPNPDLIYPKDIEKFGFTTGTIALMIETGLKIMFGDNAPSFERLGKPFTPIFLAAKAKFPGKSLVMIGDQQETDIKGAKAASIPSVLIKTGVTQIFSIASPDFVLEDLSIVGTSFPTPLDPF